MVFRVVWWSAALALATAAPPPPPKAPPSNVSYISSVRYPMEGGHTVSLCTAPCVRARAPQVAVNYLPLLDYPGCSPALTLWHRGCTYRPLAAGGAPATAPSAAVSWPGVSLRFPTRSHGHALDAPSPNGTTGCFVVATGVTATAGPGLLSLRASGGGTDAGLITQGVPQDPFAPP